MAYATSNSDGFLCAQKRSQFEYSTYIDDQLHDSVSSLALTPAFQIGG